MAVGMAIAERHLNARFGDDLVDHRTWVIAGDGCLMEGVSHEAMGLAGHLKLGRLIVLWDDNNITIDGSTDLSRSEDVLAAIARAAGTRLVRRPRFRRGPPRDRRGARRSAAVADRCRTIIGWGAPNKQGTAATHGAALGADEVAAARAARLGWERAVRHSRRRSSPPGARPAGAAAQRAREEWRARLAASPERDEFVRRMEGRLPGDAWLDAYLDGCSRIRSRSPPARRRSWRSRRSTPRCRRRSAARPTSPAPTTPRPRARSSDRPGLRRPLHLLRNPRVRHGRGDERHGAARRGDPLRRHLPGLHRLLPPGDPPLAALQGIRVIYVMTHDSIGLGEDGPTHQPVEHLPACGDAPTSTSSARPTRSRPPNAGSWRWRATGPSHARADPAEPAAAAHSRRPRRISAPAAPIACCGARRSAQGRADRHRLRGRDRASPSPTRWKRRGSAPTSSRCPAGAVRRPDEAYRADLPAGRLLKVSIEAGTTLRLGALHGHDGLASASTGSASRAGRGSLQALRLHRRGDRAARVAALKQGRMHDESCNQRFRADRPPGRPGDARAAGQRARAGLDQRPRRRQVQRLAVQARQRPRRLPGRGPRRRQRHHRRRQAHPRHRREGSGQAAARANGIDLALECTGFFTDRDKAFGAHRRARSGC
jgi:transketolase